MESRRFKCPVVTCNEKVCAGQEFVEHLKVHTAAAPYNPKGPTLFRFNCKRCEQCKEIVVIGEHECTIKREHFELPDKGKFNTVVDISWTITARGERDIQMSTFTMVKSIIDDYFEYGIASTERGHRINNLHVQAAGRIHFYDDEIKIKKLGGNMFF